jgi:uncharacterized Zn finger protein
MTLDPTLCPHCGSDDIEPLPGIETVTVRCMECRWVGHPNKLVSEDDLRADAGDRKYHARVDEGVM